MAGLVWLAIDPGPARCGWALVAFEGGRPPRYIAGGHNPCRDIVQSLTRADRVADRIAIECQGNGLYERKRHDALIKTARVEGRLLQAAESAGFAPVEFTAGQWRADVVRNASASDDEVAVAVRRRITLPELPAVAGVHILDAVGLALAAAARPGHQVALPLGRGRRTR